MRLRHICATAALALACLLAAFTPTPPPPVPTPAFTPTVLPTPAPQAGWLETTFHACKDGPLADACLQQIDWRIVVLIILIVSIIIAVATGFLQRTGEKLSDWAGRLFSRRRKTEQQYLDWFIKRYASPKFGPRSLGIQFEDQKPAGLEDIYLPVDVKFSVEKERQEDKSGGDEKHLLRSLGEGGELGLPEVLGKERVLVVTGIAGSGKSTLLQWLGLVCACKLRHKKLRGQEEVLRALGKPLFPLFVSLGAFERDCQEKRRACDAAALLGYIPASYRLNAAACEDKKQPPDLDVDFIERKLRNGCLLLLDGLDEVSPARRMEVRGALDELLSLKTGSHTRALLTARPSAQKEAYLEGARHGEVQPLDPEQRNRLIRDLYHYYEKGDWKARSDDLILRIDNSDGRVQALAKTPLMTTIFTIIHRPGHELPHQRAEVYNQAVDTLLRELHHREGVVPLALEDGDDAVVLRSRLGLAAFELHKCGSGDEGLPEGDLIEKMLPHFRGAADLQVRREEARRFLYTVAHHSGMLEELGDCTFGFRTHRSFQEFLAGWYLVNEYDSDLCEQGRFIQERLALDTDLDIWVEPVCLAAGFLAITSTKNANAFIRMVMGLGAESGQGDPAAALAGLCLADLPPKRVDADLREDLAHRMLQAFQRKPPRLNAPLRLRLGLAIGSLRDPEHETRLFDPRLHPGGMPEMAAVPAGEFLMGTSTDEEKILEKQGIKVWDDEKPAHRVALTAQYRIARFPVTNAEYNAFWEAGGYDRQEGGKGKYWSAEGWRWRNGDWQSDLQGYDETLRDQVKRWLAKRPAEKRGRPFFWNDPRWNGANQPVVGVCWFEAQAYCAWLTEVLLGRGEIPRGWAFRLPSEAEWERAARFVPRPAGKRGGAPRPWLWGNAWEPQRCNSNELGWGRTSPVGAFPDGESAAGIADLAGNVWEWCLDGYDPGEYARRRQDGEPARDPLGSQDAKLRVLRGGSWNDYRRHARCAYRFRLEPDYFISSLGFRVLLSPLPLLDSWIPVSES